VATDVTPRSYAVVVSSDARPRRAKATTDGGPSDTRRSSTFARVAPSHDAPSSIRQSSIRRFPMHDKTVVASFNRLADATAAMRDLREAGFADTDINLIASRVTQETEPGLVEDTASGAATGAIAGGALGGAAGLAAALMGLARSRPRWPAQARVRWRAGWWARSPTSASPSPTRRSTPNPCGAAARC
jgi:hypothetical protein